MARGLDWETLATHAGGVYAFERRARRVDRAVAARPATGAGQPRWPHALRASTSQAHALHWRFMIPPDADHRRGGRGNWAPLRDRVRCGAADLLSVAAMTRRTLEIAGCDPGEYPAPGLPEDAVTSGRLHWLTPSEMQERYAAASRRPSKRRESWRARAGRGSRWQHGVARSRSGGRQHAG